jgi:glycine oxidase
MKTLVVGAGIIGCSIAYELSSRGADCTLIDGRPVGGGATRASAGMLAPYVEAHERGPLLDLCVRSLDLYDEWIAAVRRDSGVDVEYRRIGTLEIALDPEQAEALRGEAHADSRVTRTWLNATDAASAHPALGPIAGALLTPVHGYVAAPQLASALASAAQARGVTLQRATVQRITREGSLSVMTSAGAIAADTVILAAGAWTNAIEGVKAPPLRPVRGQLLQLGWSGPPIDAILWGPDCYLVPRTDGTLLVGATVEEVGFDERTTVEGVRDLLAAVSALLPDATHATFLDARAGLRPATPDELPAIGPDPSMPGLVHASGHYRNGVLLAPITAKLVADLVLEGTADPALGSFSVGRFVGS